jgi:hypothetical protein
MGNTSPKKRQLPPRTAPEPAQPPKLARWVSVAVIVGAFGGVIGSVVAGFALYYTIHRDTVAAASLSSDEHVYRLIDDKLDPVKKDIQGLTAQVNLALGEFNSASLKRNVSELKQGDQSIQAKGNSQSDVMADIRANLVQAQQLRQKLPLTGLVKQIQMVPASAKDYWLTVAAIINYQSYLNQLDHNAPSPDSVAGPCMFVTEGSPNISNNVLFGKHKFKRCIVDLDTSTNTVQDAVIEDSVVRYHGGEVTFKNVLFINCRFIVDIKAPQVPTRPDLLLSLLKSDQSYFRIPNAG